MTGTVDVFFYIFGMNFLSSSRSIAKSVLIKKTRRFHLNKEVIFEVLSTVHRNQLYEQTNKMHFLYIFILQTFYNSTFFERPIRSSSGVHDLPYLQLCTNCALHGLYRAADSINNELLIILSTHRQHNYIVCNLYSGYRCRPKF